jgi:hypothetical protein
MCALLAGPISFKLRVSMSDGKRVETLEIELTSSEDDDTEVCASPALTQFTTVLCGCLGSSCVMFW